MSKNPYLKDVEEYIADICRDKGITEDAPFIQREMRGEWVYDTEAMVFKGYRTYDNFNDPQIAFPIDFIVVGNDYGWAANNAVIGVAYSKSLQKGYVFYESQFNHANVTTIINENKKCLEKAREILNRYNVPSSKVMIFGDTSDTSIISEMATVHKLPAFQCYKYDKDEAIAHLAEMCCTGKLLIPKDGVLETEFNQILYKRDEETDAIIPEIDDNIFHPDAAMALLYASRQIALDWGIETIRNGKSSLEKDLNTFVRR
jgi:hypothetical protein